jgi:hypothetical protein
MIIAGAKGFAKEVLQVYYRDYDKSNIFFFDNVNKDLGDMLYQEFPIIKTNKELENYILEFKDFALGIGTPKTRKILYDFFVVFGANPISIISKKANIGYFETKIGDACSIMGLRKKKGVPNMVHNNLEVLEHWNKEDVECMYDKHSINALIRLLKSHSLIGAKFLDSFGGKGEEIFEYSKVKWDDLK